MKESRKLIYKFLLGVVAAIIIMYLCHSNIKPREGIYEFIDKNGHAIEINCAKLVKYTNEDSLYIEYPYLYAKDQNSCIINEQIYNAIIDNDMLLDDGYADRAEIEYDVSYIDDRIISIHFMGNKGKGMDNNNFDMGMNFNLSNGEILCLASFYSLREMQELLGNAIEEDKLSIIGIPLNESEIEEYINNFLKEFDSNNYISKTDNFYVKEDRIFFLAKPYQSMNQIVCLELEVDELPDIKNK